MRAIDEVEAEEEKEKERKDNIYIIDATREVRRHKGTHTQREREAFTQRETAQKPHT